MYTFHALQILIFLIPGFISQSVLDMLLVRKEQKEFTKIIEALVFSVFVRTFHSFVSGVNPIKVEQIKVEQINESILSFSYDWKSLGWLTFFSIILPIIFCLIDNNNWHIKLARRLRISNASSRDSTWLEVFRDKKEKYIIINFDNGRRIYGWPEYYSDDHEKPYVYLSNPAWIVEEEFVQLNVEGILITPEQKIEFIEFF